MVEVLGKNPKSKLIIGEVPESELDKILYNSEEMWPDPVISCIDAIRERKEFIIDDEIQKKFNKKVLERKRELVRRLKEKADE